MLDCINSICFLIYNVLILVLIPLPLQAFDWDVYLQTHSASPAPISAFVDVTGREVSVMR